MKLKEYIEDKLAMGMGDVGIKTSLEDRGMPEEAWDQVLKLCKQWGLKIPMSSEEFYQKREEVQQVNCGRHRKRTKRGG